MTDQMTKAALDAPGIEKLRHDRDTYRGLLRRAVPMLRAAVEDAHAQNTRDLVEEIEEALAQERSR